MDDRKVPWWRKALSFALDGIRSGFGLFSKPQKEDAVHEPEIVSAREDAPEEETKLTEHSPIVEEIAELVDEPMAEPRAEVAVAGDEETAEPERSVETEAVPEAASETAFDEAPEASIEIRTAPEVAVRVPQAEVDDVLATVVKTVAAEEPIAEPADDLVVETPASPAEAEPASAIGAEAVDVNELQQESALAKTQVEPAVEEEKELHPEISSEPENLSVEPVAIAAPPQEDSNGEPTEEEEASAEIMEEASESRVDLVAEAPPESVVLQEEAPVDELGAQVELPAEEELVQEPVDDVAEPVEEIAEAEPVTKMEYAPEPVIIEEAFPTEDSVPEPAVSYLELSEPVLEEVTAEVPAQFEVVEEYFAEVRAPFPEAIPEIEQALEEVTELDPETVNESMELNEPIPEQQAETTEASESEAVTEPVAATAAIEAAANQEAPEPAAEPILPAEQAEVDQPEPEPVVAVATTPAAPHKPFIKLESRDNEADLSPFSVIVSQVYDGPLDLLLDLIRKQDIDIYDIPIARITAQFLAYVNQLKATDVDVAGEFIYTASLLIHIKSKMLLPRAPSGQDDAAEDPRRELVERLLEHERFKNAAQMLQQKQMLEAASWTNPGMREFKDDTSAEPEIAADTVDLVRIFRDILERARNRPVINVEEDSVTVGQMIQFLARRLTMEDKPVALRRLLSQTRSERALIAMFLALLELVRLQAILLRQDLAFSEIFIKKHTGFEAVMNEGAASARDDWR